MAGLAVTRALYRHAAAAAASSLGVAVTVFDPAEPGTCLGATAVAAGLLHPLSPRGKLVWGGEEGLAATLQLVKEARNQGEGVQKPAGQKRRALANLRSLQSLSGRPRQD